MNVKMPKDSNGAVDPVAASVALSKRQLFAHMKRRLFEPLEAYKRALESETSLGDIND